MAKGIPPCTCLTGRVGRRGFYMNGHDRGCPQYVPRILGRNKKEKRHNWLTMRYPWSKPRVGEGWYEPPTKATKRRDRRRPEKVRRRG